MNMIIEALTETLFGVNTGSKKADPVEEGLKDPRIKSFRIKKGNTEIEINKKELGEMATGTLTEKESLYKKYVSNFLGVDITKIDFVWITSVSDKSKFMKSFIYKVRYKDLKDQFVEVQERNQEVNVYKLDRLEIDRK
ncbi:MAG: hypothetical protein ACOC1K_04215 [Nanoarchaeota archaeon]